MEGGFTSRGQGVRFPLLELKIQFILSEVVCAVPNSVWAKPCQNLSLWK